MRMLCPEMFRLSAAKLEVVKKFVRSWLACHAQSSQSIMSANGSLHVYASGG